MSEARYLAQSGELRRFAAPARPVHEVTALAVSPLRLQALADRPEQLLGLMSADDFNHIELQELSSDEPPLLVPQHWKRPAVLVISGSIRVDTQVRGGKQTSLVFAASVLQLAHSHAGLPTRTLLQPSSCRAKVALFGFRPAQIAGW